MEHQAGIPVLMKPLSGNSSDAKDFGEVVAPILTNCRPPMARRIWWPIVLSIVQTTSRSSPRPG